MIRDQGYPVARAERGSMLDDARDILVDEVVVDFDGEVSLLQIVTGKQ